jgi:hypothetical protein
MPSFSVQIKQGEESMGISIPMNNHLEERMLICMRSKDGWCDNATCYDEGGQCPYGEEEEEGDSETS